MQVGERKITPKPSEVGGRLFKDLLTFLIGVYYLGDLCDWVSDQKLRHAAGEQREGELESRGTQADFAKAQ